MKKKSERKRKEMRNFTAIGIYYYAFCAALFFERSIWINYLQSENYTAVQIGVLQSILTVAMFIFELPFGLMTDRFGAKNNDCRTYIHLRIHDLHALQFWLLYAFRRFYCIWNRFVSDFGQRSDAFASCTKRKNVHA